MKSTVYSGKDYNVFEIKAPAAATDEVAVVDIADVSKGDVRGEAWRVGIRTDGLAAEAGQPVRVRILNKYDRFFLSDAGFKSAPTVGKFATARSSFLPKPKLLVSSTLRSKLLKISFLDRRLLVRCITAVCFNF